eukprot:Rhum_TRINITY_DN13253_c0_g1::Rhum_TRINITY_DN13253_c0_g1_i1::g.58457::m.58457
MRLLLPGPLPHHPVAARCVVRRQRRRLHVVDHATTRIVFPSGGRNAGQRLASEDAGVAGDADHWCGAQQQNSAAAQDDHHFGPRILKDHRCADILGRFVRRLRYTSKTGADAKALTHEFHASIRRLSQYQAQFGARSVLAMLMFYAKLGNATKAEAVLAKAQRNGITAEPAMWSSLLVAYKNAQPGGDLSGVQGVLRRMAAADPPVHLDATMYCTVIVCLPSIKLRLAALSKMVRVERWQPSVYHYNAVLSGPVGAAHPYAAHKRFFLEHGDDAHRPAPNGVSFALLLRSCGTLAEVDDVLAWQRKDGVPATALFSDTLLSKYGALRAPDRLDEAFLELRSEGSRLTAATYSLYVTCKVDSTSAAELPFVESVFAEGVARHPLYSPLYTAMLKHYVHHRNKGAARRLRAALRRNLPNLEKEFEAVYASLC